MADVALATMLVNLSSLPLFRKMQHRVITQYAARACLRAPRPSPSLALCFPSAARAQHLKLEEEATPELRRCALCCPRRQTTMAQVRLAQNVLLALRAMAERFIANSAAWLFPALKAATPLRVLLAGSSAAAGWMLASKLWTTRPKSAAMLAWPYRINTSNRTAATPAQEEAVEDEVPERDLDSSDTSAAMHDISDILQTVAAEAEAELEAEAEAEAELESVGIPVEICSPKRAEGPSPVFETDDEDVETDCDDDEQELMEHAPEEVVDTRTALRTRSGQSWAEDSIRHALHSSEDESSEAEESVGPCDSFRTVLSRTNSGGSAPEPPAPIIRTTSQLARDTAADIDLTAPRSLMASPAFSVESAASLAPSFAGTAFSESSFATVNSHRCRLTSQQLDDDIEREQPFLHSVPKTGRRSSDEAGCCCLQLSRPRRHL